LYGTLVVRFGMQVVRSLFTSFGEWNKVTFKTKKKFDRAFSLGGARASWFFFLPADEGDHPGDGQTMAEGWVVKNVVKFICLQGWP
jgi:hypothetical protein